MRFDFTHFAALTRDELNEIEQRINDEIQMALPVKSEELPIEEAKARGAIALFNEKYGDTVRMVTIGEGEQIISMELCGGTHAKSTGNLGMFMITSESSVASGVRRIEAVTAAGAYAHYRDKNKYLLEATAAALKANNVNELEARAQSVMAQLKEAEKELAALREKLSGYAVQDLLQSAKAVGNVKFVSGALGGDLRQACDQLKQSGGAVVALFAAKTDKGLQFAAACSPGAVKAGAHAGNLVRAAAQTAGGSGGGRPDSAMAGGKDPAKLEAALASGEAALASMLQL